MPKRALSLTLLTAAVVASRGSSARPLIGDVVTSDSEESLRGSSPSQQLQQPRRRQRSLNANTDILASMLGKEHFDIDRDECLQSSSPFSSGSSSANINATDDSAGLISDSSTRPVYGRCDVRKFPYCHGDRPNICFNRINRQDAFHPDKHPKYYIDYDRIHCYPDRVNNVDFTCSSCSPGRWCMPEGRCILDENMYHCWAGE